MILSRPRRFRYFKNQHFSIEIETMETIDPLNNRLTAARSEALRQVFLEAKIGIISCRLFRNQAPWSVPRRTCPDSFFLFPLRGRVRVILDGSNRELAPGQFLMLPEGAPHALDIGRNVRKLDQISLHCHIHDRWNRPLLAQFAKPFGQLPQSDEWLESLLDLAACQSPDPALGQARGDALLRELLSHRLRGEAALPHPFEAEERMVRALQLIEERITSPQLSVESLATELGLSTVQFRKLFRQATRSSPRHYLNRLRLQKSARLLRHSNSSVKTIAYECGFGSDHYFHLVFRKNFGCTPSDYRRGRTV